MADYWKSQPRKFCQYCKCWIADNKPSVEFHERGKNHKENVAAKISEIKKKSVDKAKQEARMSKDFAAMEEAAMKAYEEDLKRMEREAAGLGPLAEPPPIPPPKPVIICQTKKHFKKLKSSKKSAKQRETQDWAEGQSEDGHTYYYNSVTGESRWEKPHNFRGECSTPANLPQAKSQSSRPWMEALSPDGYTYYYNSETGESSWEKPADFPSSEASGSGSSKEESQEKPSTPQPEPLSAGEESSNEAQPSKQTEVPVQASQQPNVAKISFRKRKFEDRPPQKEEDKEDKAGDDSPKEDAEVIKKEEAVQSTTAEPEERKVKESKNGIIVARAKRPKKTNPYGVWEEIQEEEDPYTSIDLQLPKVEASMAGAPADLPPEPKPKFRERIITSLGDEGGPASFRKNKPQNGKSRSLRQRDEDDD